VNCLERCESIGEVYNIVGSETLDWKRMLETFRDKLPQSDKSLPVIGLPGPPHVIMAHAAGFLGLGGVFPFDAGMPAMAQQDATADLTKLRTHLNVSPKGFSETIGYVAAMK
jgi:hypothetical protein